MTHRIGLCRDGFGITEALAVHMLRSIGFSKIVLISHPDDAAQCHATVGFGRADLVLDHFSNDVSEYTLEELNGLEGYAVKLSSAGQVYAKFARQLIQQKDDERGTIRKGRHSRNRDFRKLYEYIIEVVDSWHWDIPLQYPMTEKTQLIAFLDELQNKMDSEWADNRETDFLMFVEQCVAEIGRKFDQICCWYFDCYLPAFEFVCDTLTKTDDFGVMFFDFNFAKVTLDDLLIRAGNNLRLPRLIIRPSFNKFRVECVRMVKPILYFPREWVGRSDHVMETLDIEQIDYISSERTYAIARTLEAAEQLAYRLLAYAEESSNIVTSQDCSLTINKNLKGNNVLQSVRSLPATRDNSTSRELRTTTVTDSEQTEKAVEDQNKKKRLEKASMELKKLAGIAANYNENTAVKTAPKIPMPCNSNRAGETIGTPNCADEGKENSPVLLLDFNDDNDRLPMAPSEGRHENHQQMNTELLTAYCQNGSTREEKQQFEASSSSSSMYSISQSADLPEGIHHQMENGVSPQQSKESGDFVNYDNFDVESIVKKVFEAKRTILEVSDNAFTISHVLGATFVGLAIGTGGQNLQIQSLAEPRKVGCSVRLGPGIYEYDDGDHKFTSSHLVSLFSLDLSPEILDKRLSIAGLCYAFYAKKAIAKIAADGSPGNLSILLKKVAVRRKLSVVFRRVYRRLVLPIDQWVGDFSSDQHLPLATREAGTLQSILSGLIDVANYDKGRAQNANGQQQKMPIVLSSAERLVAFRTALHICMQYVNDMVRSLLVDE